MTGHTTPTLLISQRPSSPLVATREALLLNRREMRSPSSLMSGSGSTPRTQRALFTVATPATPSFSTQTLSAARYENFCYFIYLPREIFLKIILYCDIVSLCRLEISSRIMGHLISVSGFYKRFAQKSRFKLVRHLGSYLSANSWFASTVSDGINEFSRPRLVKYPLVLEYNLDLMLRLLLAELDRECIKLRIRFEALQSNRLHRGYQNCFKGCCALARQVLYLELLYIRIRAVRDNKPFPRAGMTAPHAVNTVLWPTEVGQNKAVISSVLGIFHNRSFASGGSRLRISLFKITRSLMRCYYHMFFPARRTQFTMLILRPDLAPLAVRLPNGLKCIAVPGMPMFAPPIVHAGGVAIIDVESSDEDEAFPNIGTD